MKTRKKILSVLAIILGLAMIASLTFGLTACGDDGDEGKKLAAPIDFTIDIDTGDFSFTAIDENVGYYFVRAYNVINGEEFYTYATSSSRINGGDTGTKTGTLDMSTIGWGDYNFKLVTFAPAGTDYIAPDPVVISAEFGIGGTMETPELLAMYSGNTVEIVIEWVSLNDYYVYQGMPTIRLDFYSDEECTSKVLTDYIETTDLLSIVDGFAFGEMVSYNWGSDSSVLFRPINKGTSFEKGYALDAYDYTTADLPKGEYYVTATALAPTSYIQNSNTSEAIKFVLTDEEATEDFQSSQTSNYTAPTGQDFITCGVDKNRENSGSSQNTTSRIVT